jgi:hypothetical protein
VLQGCLSERLLTPPEAAALLDVTVTWLYRHAGRLPFARRLSRKALRFSEPGCDDGWPAGSLDTCAEAR